MALLIEPWATIVTSKFGPLLRLHFIICSCLMYLGHPHPVFFFGHTWGGGWRGTLPPRSRTHSLAEYRCAVNHLSYCSSAFRLVNYVVCFFGPFGPHNKKKNYVIRNFSLLKSSFINSSKIFYHFN